MWIPPQDETPVLGSCQRGNLGLNPKSFKYLKTQVSPQHDGQVLLVDLRVLQEHHLERHVLAADLVTAEHHLAEGALACRPHQ